MPLRQHDVVLAEGNFRVVLTNRRRLFAVIEAQETALGPLRIAFEIDRGQYLRELALERQLHEQDHLTAGFFDDIGHAMSHVVSDVGHGLEHVAKDAARDAGRALGGVAEGAFNAASKVATTLARPVFDTVKNVAGASMHLLAQHLPFLPEGARKGIEAASRIVMRARLGDLTAKDFIRGVVSAARAGVEGARKIGDALLTGSRFVAHVLDLPMRLMEHIPGVGGFMKGFSPFAKFETMTTLLQKGDFNGLKKMVTDDVKAMQGVISLFPGIGTGISTALSLGMALLDGGGPLDIAIKTAYGAIPIPPGIRTITDAVLDGVLALAKKGAALTDAVIAAARDAVPSGLPRDVFDTLANLVVKRHPPGQIAGELLDHYVKKFTGGITDKLAGTISATITTGGIAHELDVARVLESSRLVQPLARILPEDMVVPVFSASFAVA
jgi:hypothetical protein